MGVQAERRHDIAQRRDDGAVAPLERHRERGLGGAGEGGTERADTVERRGVEADQELTPAEAVGEERVVESVGRAEPDLMEFERTLHRLELGVGVDGRPPGGGHERGVAGLPHGRVAGYGEHERNDAELGGAVALGAGGHGPAAQGVHHWGVVVGDTEEGAVLACLTQAREMELLVGVAVAERVRVYRGAAGATGLPAMRAVMMGHRSPP